MTSIKSGKSGWRLDEEFDHMKESKEFLKMYKKMLTKHYGRRCKKRCNNCYCCEIWSLYDMTEILLA
jgi:hypothetical protein